MRARRLIGGTAAALLALLLSGCGALNELAVTRMDGQAAVVNCGIYIHSVVARDADTGRTVWAAHSDPQVTSYGEATVIIGTLPDGWIETANETSTQPTRWAFTVDNFPSVTVDDAKLRANHYLHDGEWMDKEDFHDDVCEEDGGPIVRAIKYAGLAILTFLAILPIVLIIRQVSGMRPADRTPGWYERKGIWRYWDGSTWN